MYAYNITKRFKETDIKHTIKEEDPLMIGYITRKGTVLSAYGRAYIEELTRYKEL